MKFLLSPVFRLPAVALAFAGFLIASPAEAKDKKDKKDKHSDHDDHHSRDGNWFHGDWRRDHRDRDHNHDHHDHRLEVRSCYSHDHHHSHVWHSRRSHQDYRCPGHR